MTPRERARLRLPWRLGGYPATIYDARGNYVCSTYWDATSKRRYVATKHELWLAQQIVATMNGLLEEDKS